jgi:DNA repair exonuclease SbcCD ATPase subunit
MKHWLAAAAAAPLLVACASAGATVAEAESPSEVRELLVNGHRVVISEGGDASTAIARVLELEGGSSEFVMEFHENHEGPTLEMLEQASPELAELLSGAQGAELNFHSSDGRSFRIDRSAGEHGVMIHRFDGDIEMEIRNAWTAARNAQTLVRNAGTEARNAQTAARNAETEARNAETAARNAETEARNAETAARNAETEARNAETAARNAETEARNIEQEALNSDQELRNAAQRLRNARQAVRNADQGLRNAEQGLRYAEQGLRNAERMTAQIEHHAAHAHVAGMRAGVSGILVSLDAIDEVLERGWREEDGERVALTDEDRADLQETRGELLESLQELRGELARVEGSSHTTSRQVRIVRRDGQTRGWLNGEEVTGSDLDRLLEGAPDAPEAPATPDEDD